MNEQEQDRYEAELRRARSAPLPAQFMDRLRAAKPDSRPSPSQPKAQGMGWRPIWRWLAPGMAVAGLAVALSKINPQSNPEQAPAADHHALKADDVRVDQELVLSYDVVAKLPGGEPVRFRCEKWSDQWVVKDKRGGLEIQENCPRVEVVPVRFETY